MNYKHVNGWFDNMFSWKYPFKDSLFIKKNFFALTQSLPNALFFDKLWKHSSIKKLRLKLLPKKFIFVMKIFKSTLKIYTKTRCTKWQFLMKKVFMFTHMPIMLILPWQFSKNIYYFCNAYKWITFSVCSKCQ